MRSIRKADKRVIDAFTERRAASGHLLSTNGKTLRLEGFGGGVVARWSGRQITMPQASTRLEQQIQRAVRREAPKNLLANRRNAKRRNRKNWGRGNVQGPLGPGPATHAGWIYDQYRNFYYNPRYTGKPIQSLSEMSDAELKKLYRTWLRAGGNGGVQKALKKEFRKRFPHKFPMKAAANPRYVSSYAKEWTLSSGGKRHPGWLKARNKRTGAVVWGKPAQFGNSAWRKRHGLPKYIAKAARRNRR